jgi:hypothetical protein
VFAVTLNQKVAGIVFLGSMFVYFVSVTIVKKRAQRAGG